MKKLFSLENLIYLTILLLPVYLLKLALGGVPTNLLEILIGLVFLGWLARIKFRPARVKLPDRKFIFSAGLIFFGLLLSTSVNPDPLPGLGIIKGWFVLPWLLGLVVYNFFPEDKLVNVFRALYVSSLAVALISLGYLLVGRLTYDGRLEAFFDSPNYLAMYLAPAIIMGVLALGRIPNFKFQNRSVKAHTVFFCLSLVVLGIAFYFTYSYAAWLSALASVLAVFLVRKNISFKKVGLAAALVVILIISQLNSPKFIGLVTLNPRSSLASRLMIWRSAGKMLENHWLFGIGPGNFQAEYLAYQKYFPPYLEWAVPHPQNVYLAIWLYGGILAFVGFLALLYFYFQNILRNIKNVSTAGPLYFVSLALVLYFLIHGLVDTTILKNDLAVVFWLGFLALR